MRERAAQGTWVEIHRIVLSPEGRAQKVPDDTRRVPLEMKVKGFLVHEGTVGEEAEILTLAGRRLRGILTRLEPAYTHGFGSPIAELAAIGPELRAMLEERGGGR
jgi:hypothetical protein